ncbi:MAG: DUF1731 domain-containing protein, partial [Terriglobales bacterium]
GRQYLPWIHIEDMVGVILAALADARYHGALNLAAPQAVTSREFARALGRALHRPALLPAPAPLLKLLFGDAAQVLLTGQRARPRALQALGYDFRYPELDAALRALLHR